MADEPGGTTTQEPEAKTTPTTEPAAGDEKAPNATDEQQKIDAAFAQVKRTERERGAADARKALLEQMGLPPEADDAALEAAKAGLGKLKELEDAQKSELQRKDEAITALQQQLEAANSRNAEQEAQLKDLTHKSAFEEAARGVGITDPANLKLAWTAVKQDNLLVVEGDDEPDFAEVAKKVVDGYASLKDQPKRPGSTTVNTNGNGQAVATPANDHPYDKVMEQYGAGKYAR